MIDNELKLSTTNEEEMIYLNARSKSKFLKSVNLQNSFRICSFPLQKNQPVRPKRKKENVKNGDNDSTYSSDM